MSNVTHDAQSRRFTMVTDGLSAELDYTLSGAVMNITHTGVPDAIAGRGVAAQLMQAACKAAEEKGWRINPVCSYASAYLAKHPDAARLYTEAAARRHGEELLDEALDESFPASDPPSVGGVN